MINKLTGQKIGVFQVIGDSGKRQSGGSGGVLWTVRCSICKKERTLTKFQMHRYQSCGCISRELLSISLRKSLNREGCGGIYATHWSSIKKNAKTRNLNFEISVKYAWKLFLSQDKKCALTGVELKFPTRCWSKDGTASLDRIDSTRGYVRGNIQWVHKEINMMKQQYSIEKFFDWCNRVVKHNKL